MASLAIGLSVCGVVASFARGAFISLLIILLLRMLIGRRILANIAGTLTAGILIYGAAIVLFPSGPNGEANPFWQEMGTISQGTAEGTGFDRKVLWGVAWEEFKDNPIIGVGPLNFGVRAPDYVERIPDRGDRYLDPASIWGRALHNGYFQILSEGGLLGVAAYLLVVIEFWRLNRRTSRSVRDLPNRAAEVSGLTRGFGLALTAFLLNMAFYDIIYYNWFWDLVVLNAVLAQRVIALKPPVAIKSDAPKAAHNAVRPPREAHWPVRSLNIRSR
jgi:O-antigen ligase